MDSSSPALDLSPAADSRREHAPMLIHVGLHKTGTTWLQDGIFANEAFGFATPWGAISSVAVAEFVNRDQMSFNADEARAKFASGLADARARGLVPVLSHEALSSRPARGTYYGAYVADKLAEVFPGARIVIGIREQKSILLSLYRQYVRNGGREKLTAFIGTGNEPEGWAPIVTFDFLKYDRFVAYYRKRFGDENVLVLPLELLASDRTAYLDRLARFAGVPAIEPKGLDKASNAGWGGVTLSVQRHLNAFLMPNRLSPKDSAALSFFRRFCYKFDPRVPKWLNDKVEAAWRAEIKARVGDHFRESNSKLSAMIGEDLGALRYPVLESKP